MQFNNIIMLNVIICTPLCNVRALRILFQFHRNMVSYNGILNNIIENDIMSCHVMLCHKHSAKKIVLLVVRQQSCDVQLEMFKLSFCGRLISNWD